MPQPRELADDYRLEKIIGSSRGASLLRGTQLRTGRAVVIKLINVPAAAGAATAAALAARFVEHAAELAQLRHPNLPVVLDWGLTPEGGAFLVMEPLDGVGFDSHPLGAGAPPDRVLPLLMQVLAGLAELAGRGLAHLNLCPENLLLALEAAAAAPAPALPSAVGASPSPQPRLTVKLLGLGTALFHLGQPWPEAAGARYRAPELAAPGAAQAPPDWRADCYSLALTACNALGATVALGEASGAIVQMPLALSFELANDEALRQILERSLRQALAERPAHAAIREAFILALGAGGETAETGETGTASPSLPWSGDARTGAAFGPSARNAALPDRSARRPLAELMASEPSLFGVPLPDLHGQAGDSSHASDAAHASDASHAYGSADASGGAQASDDAGMAGPHSVLERSQSPPPAADGDSLLDFFAVPATLPEIDDDPAGFHAGFGLHLPEGFDPTAEPAAAAESSPEHEGGWAGSIEPFAGFGDTGPHGAFAEAADAAAPAAEEAMPSAAGQATSQAGSAAPHAEMLSAVDELLNSLPPPPPPTSAAQPTAAAVARAGGGRSDGVPAAAGGRAPSGSATVATTTAPGRLRTFLGALPRSVRFQLAAGALLLVVAAAAFALLGRGPRQPSAAAAAAAAGMDGQAAPAARPGRSAAAKFLDAKSYLISGRDSDERVRQALRELSFADQGELGDEGCRQLSAIQRTLAIAALETVQPDLANGLRNGDLAALQSVVEVASDRDLPPAQQGDFERARRLVSLYRQAQAAAAGADHAQVLVQFHAMDGLARNLRDPLELRDKAAHALEADAATLAGDGRYDEAVTRLEPILGAWPARAGIKELVKSYRAAAANESAQLALLDSLPGYERHRKPSEALDLLRPLTPTPHLAARIAEARQRLEAQLAQLDAAPPEVRLRDGYVLDYSRGALVTLSFRVTDDYQVNTVKLYAKPAGGRMRELPLQRQGLAYTVEIPPSIHQNGTVELYVVATDLSGHEGSLGSKDRPLRLTRRQGFERLLR